MELIDNYLTIYIQFIFAVDKFLNMGDHAHHHHHSPAETTTQAPVHDMSGHNHDHMDHSGHMNHDNHSTGEQMMHHMMSMFVSSFFKVNFK